MNPVRVTFQRESGNCSHRFGSGSHWLRPAGCYLPACVQGRSLLPLARGAAQWCWERDFPQTPTVLGLRTDRYCFMQYHGVWHLDELYDIQKDPGQMNNLMGDVRTTTQGASLPGRASYFLAQKAFWAKVRPDRSDGVDRVNAKRPVGRTDGPWESWSKVSG